MIWDHFGHRLFPYCSRPAVRLMVRNAYLSPAVRWNDPASDYFLFYALNVDSHSARQPHVKIQRTR